MSRTLEGLQTELDELMRHVREHGTRLQRDIEALKRRAEEKARMELAEHKKLQPEDAAGSGAISGE